MTITRRRLLQTGIALGSLRAIAEWGTDAFGAPLPAMKLGEDLFRYIDRTTGGENQELYRKLLGNANEWKEGDEILGVAAQSAEQRIVARELLSNTKISAIDEHPPFQDKLLGWIDQARDSGARKKTNDWTLGELKRFLLDEHGDSIQSVASGLSSDVIACVVKLLSNEELIAVGAKVFHPLPGTQVGAKGYMGARIQPNSPTDHPEDIRWQVFDAFAYAVGDVLIGTNPVSSEVDSVAAVEATLKDIVDTFEIASVLPHCVLSHIDIQAEIEKRDPGATALWFQSIAGSDAANGTFDVTTEKMLRHAGNKSGAFGMYFETGQGADFTNGHGAGTDMVIHESRKYGLARMLTKALVQAKQKRGEGSDAWVHLNDVAGFIGPEVFRTKEQLVRCCLEDIVMGKLHGLMIGLDICTTLHMDVSLDDLGWCIDQIMPANPGYLMALPTRIDPMLGYLTTGYHDHVRIREKFGYRVGEAMWKFFQGLGVIDSQGNPTEHFGDPTWVYVAYARRKGDQRAEGELRLEARQRIDAVRERGVFIAEGYSKSISELPVKLEQQIHEIYDDAKQCIWAELPQEFEAKFPGAISIETQSKDRNDYILHPSTGEELSQASIDKVAAIRNKYGQSFDTVLVVSDGLNALANTTEFQAEVLIASLRKQLTEMGAKVYPETFIVRSGRVRAGYRIGENLFGERDGQQQVLHVVGERPGSGHRTLSIYITRAAGLTWGVPSKVDHNITKVVSGIAKTALSPEHGADAAARILRTMI